jgi:hypothetical protein
VNSCDIRPCREPVTIVYLTICAEGHIDDFYLCTEHAVLLFTYEKTCTYTHPVEDHMVATLDGGEPEDYRFYPGEWVAIVNKKVIKHGFSSEEVVDYALRNGCEGANIWQIRERLKWT